VGGKARKKEPLRRARRRCVNNIILDGCVWTGLVWFGIGTNEGSFRDGYESSGSIDVGNLQLHNRRLLTKSSASCSWLHFNLKFLQSLFHFRSVGIVRSQTKAHRVFSVFYFNFVI
jgi:hypothetical protein